jgi:hypothetical protein
MAYEDLSSEDSEELKLMRERHAELARQLEEYESRPFLTPLDDLEMKKIKKKKLACKDAIERIIIRQRQMQKKGDGDIG